MEIPFRDILLVILGGLFGWTLGKLPDKVVYGVAAIAILLIVIVIKN
jgi:hypothetical protein